MEKSTYKKKQGSILIGVIIIFLMISSLSVAIISRSLQGTILTTDSKKGYIAYQNSDKNTENFSNSFKTLDNNGGGNKIPENSNALNFCSAGTATCSNAIDGTLLYTNTVADIFSFKAVSDRSQGAIRAISAPVPGRIDGKLVTGDLTVKNCDGTVATCNIGGQPSYNKCDMSVKVNTSSFDPATMKNYEVRKSTHSSLTYGLTSNTLYGWQKVLGPVMPGNYFGNSNSAVVIQNGDTDSNIVTSTTTTQNGGQYGKTYYFTIKARNLKPFTLDSLYLADSSGNTSKKVDLDQYNTTTSCPALSGPLANCLARGTNPAGTETATTPYNCCNGSECYQPIVGWSDETNKNCALQNCSASDGIGANPTGTASTGYCGTVQACQPGRGCKASGSYPYRTVAYCISAPTTTAPKEIGIVLSGWSLQNKQDVYMSPSSDKTNYPNPPDVPYPDGKPRCSRHDCPTPTQVVAGDHTAYCGALPYHGNAWDTTGTSCTTATCGEYSLAKSCVLSCNTPGRYSPYSGSIASGYSSGKDCTETCPSGPPFTSNDPQKTEGACSYTLPSNGTSWTNNSSCQSNTRPATASQHGYTVTESCSLNCSSADLGYYPVNRTNPSLACCYGNCPSDSRTKACQAGSCNGVCGGYSDTRTEWDKTCTTVSCPLCGVENNCTPDCSGSTNGSCNSVYDCPSEPSCACGYSGSCSYSCTGAPVDTRVCKPTKSCSTPSCPTGKSVKGTCDTCTGTGLYCG